MADNIPSRRRHDRNRRSRVLLGTLLAIVTVSAHAAAQPSIAASVTPPPNRFGWNNTPVRVAFTCTGVPTCPEPIVVTGEGARQQIAQAFTNDSGRTAIVTTEVNLDFTAAAISWTSPLADSTITAAGVRVTARAADTLSGVVSATCNGDSAGPQGDTIACDLPLADGINDLVVQVLDRAGNSSSTGVQVHRVGPVSRITIVPSALVLITGEPHALTVVDNFGRPVAGLEWFVENPSFVSIAADHTSMTALSPGATTVTAKSATLATSIKVVVVPGPALPDGMDRWDIEELPGYRTVKPMEFFHVTPRDEHSPRHLAVEHEIAGPGLILRAVDDDPTQWWIETPAISRRESIGAQLAGDELGTGLVRVQTSDGLSSSIVRVGRPREGTLWRYTPMGSIGEAFATRDGLVDVVETPADGFPVLVSIDLETGSAKHRVVLPTSSVTTLNAACVSGVSARQDRPAAVGRTPTVLRDGTINLALSTTEEVEDALPCGRGTRRSERKVQLMQVEPGDAPTYRTVYEFPSGPERVEVTLREVMPDGHGGQLVAWTARIGTRPPQHTIVRVSEDALLTFHLPALGQILLTEDDMGVTCDGRTIVGFDLTNGTTLWTHHAPAGGSFRLIDAGSMSVTGDGVRVATERGIEHIDRQGQRALLSTPPR